ncbi:ComEC/Rec2 family competence protein [Amaricoccus sp.]|uniref:ComEC/Rec2 family competence protein n=1 Tax=Amaricoccus sp. TaxID=1872485 RepID=UPI0026241486|nr:ComEC/Rec2 family competence protein [Amaricoccus sp.]HRO09987.1 ComEC/Rec2 family competence protein [Amaricoccus sp.]
MGRERLAALIETQRPQLALWIPVLLALGIGGYFALPAEPEGWMLVALAGVMAVGFATLFRVGVVGRVALLAALLPALGLQAAALRTWAVAAPVIGHEMTAAVEGRIVGLDRSASDRPRVLLDRVVIHGLEPERTPARVRVSLDPATPRDLLRPGVRILGQARLSPPGAPAEPGGFDFRRLAFFERIGAVGYARTPMVAAYGPEPGRFRQLPFRLRMAASAHIQRVIPGQDGAFTAAILTGDRSGIDRSVEAALRASSLYHIVSISGLHMSLLAAAVFAMIRYGLALVPRLALAWPLKKIAAVAAMVAGAVYLVISGSEVPAQRSYVMTATVLLAVLLERPALTLRAVALAGVIVLLFAPESLMQPGFQMSFAATAALVASFEALRGRAWWQVTQTAPGWRFARPVLGIAVTSLIAGAATAPISAFHFNTIAQYGVLANLLALPAMGIVVMPASVVAVGLAPLGLDWLPFRIAGLGMGYIIAVARFVAGLGGAVTGVPAGPALSLGLILLGGTMAVLLLGRARWAALAPAAVALLLWAGHGRPEVLVAGNGRLFGFLTPSGRVLSSERGNGYAAETWLRNDGDGATQAEAWARGRLVRRAHRIEAEVPGIGRLVYVGTREMRGADGICAAAAILVAPNWPRAPRGDCLFVGRERLEREGALAIRPGPGGLTVAGALSVNQGRPWTRRPEREGAPPDGDRQRPSATELAAR